MMLPSVPPVSVEVKVTAPPVSIAPVTVTVTVALLSASNAVTTMLPAVPDTTVVKEANTTYLFIDGDLVDTKGAIPNPNEENHFRIGKQYAGGEYWNGYIDEIRLWDKMLTSEEVIFHNDNPTKLITSNGCSDPQYTTLTLCEEAEETWSGIYSDQALTKLKGLWRLNYNSPRYDIPDESCKELNLDSGVSDNDECININGTIYTLPGYSVEFSKVGL